LVLPVREVQKFLASKMVAMVVTQSLEAQLLTAVVVAVA
jgi:hypothetical protein